MFGLSKNENKLEILGRSVLYSSTFQCMNIGLQQIIHSTTAFLRLLDFFRQIFT